MLVSVEMNKSPLHINISSTAEMIGHHIDKNSAVFQLLTSSAFRPGQFPTSGRLNPKIINTGPYLVATKQYIFSASGTWGYAAGDAYCIGPWGNPGRMLNGSPSWSLIFFIFDAPTGQPSNTVMRFPVALNPFEFGIGLVRGPNDLYLGLAMNDDWYDDNHECNPPLTWSIREGVYTPTQPTQPHPSGGYVQFDFIRSADPGGALIEILDYGTGLRRPPPGTPWKVPGNATAAQCAQILAGLAQEVGAKVVVAGATVRVYPTSSKGIWYNVQPPPGMPALINDPSSGYTDER